MTIELEILVIAAAAIGLVCGLIGYWWASTNQRRAAGGKSVQELTTEKAQYEADVEEHFKETADLLNEMTDKYRDVYRHMAEGAQKLAPGENVAPALAALQSGLLAAPGEPAREAVLEPEPEDDHGDNDSELREAAISEASDDNLNGNAEELVDTGPSDLEQTTNDDNEHISDAQQDDVSSEPAKLAEDENTVTSSDGAPAETSLEEEHINLEQKGFFSDDPKKSLDLETQHPVADITRDGVEKGK